MEAAASIGNPQPLASHRRAPGLYAGFWRRLAAWLIDCAIGMAIAEAFVAIAGTWLLAAWALAGGNHGPALARLIDAALQPFAIIVVWLYYAIGESSRWQATPGKRMLGLQVVDGRGERIGFTRASVRYFGQYLSVLMVGIGFLMAGWTARKQALHDFIADCCVVRARGLAAWRREAPADPESMELAGVSAAKREVPRRVAMGCGVAVAVVVVAAFVVPVWRGHTVRSEVAQGVAATQRPRALIAEFIGERGMLPVDNADLGLPRPDALQARYVVSIKVADGKVLVTYGNQAVRTIRGRHVVLAPEGNAALLHWRCSSPDIRAVFLPSGCRD